MGKQESTEKAEIGGNLRQPKSLYTHSVDVSDNELEVENKLFLGGLVSNPSSLHIKTLNALTNHPRRSPYRPLLKRLRGQSTIFSELRQNRKAQVAH